MSINFSQFNPDPDDAYPAIVTAIAAATESRTKLRVPSGAWRVPFWPGRAAINVTCSMAGDGVFMGVSSNPSLYAMWKIERDGVTLDGITLDGGRVAQAWEVPSYWCVLSIRDCERVTLNGLTVRHGQKWGIDAHNVERLMIVSSLIERNGWSDEPPGNEPLPHTGGLRIASSDAPCYRVTLRDSIFQRNAGQGASVAGVSMLSVTKCDFVSNGLYEAHGNQDGLALGDLTDAEIRHNFADGNLADGIVITSTGAGSRSERLNISGNTAQRNGGNGILFWCAPGSGAGGIHKVTLRKNTACGNSQMFQPPNYPWGFDGIRLSPNGNPASLTGFSLRGNTCTGSEQMHGFGQLPRELDPLGGIADIDAPADQNTFAGWHAARWLWQCE